MLGALRRMAGLSSNMPATGTRDEQQQAGAHQDLNGRRAAGGGAPSQSIDDQRRQNPEGGQRQAG